MEDFVPFASRSYGLMFLLLFVSRGMDFLSTWVATPNMVLEGNPIAKKLGWKWGIPLNVALCFGFAFWPLPAIVISTTSVLVAARNFQSAWLMRSLGEQLYRDWHIERVQETSVTLYLFCLFAQTALTGGVGAAVIYFSEWRLVPLAIGLGIVAYALAVAFYTLLGIWRLRRSAIRTARLAERKLTTENTPPPPGKNGKVLLAAGQPGPAVGQYSPAPSHMYSPTLDEFLKLAAQGNLIPVTRRLLADIETPLSAYRKIRGPGESFLFESVEGGEHLGRYSFVGCNPRAIIRQVGQTVEVIENGKVVETFGIQAEAGGGQSCRPRPACATAWRWSSA